MLKILSNHSESHKRGGQPSWEWSEASWESRSVWDFIKECIVCYICKTAQMEAKGLRHLQKFLCRWPVLVNSWTGNAMQAFAESCPRVSKTNILKKNEYAYHLPPILFINKTPNIVPNKTIPCNQDHHYSRHHHHYLTLGLALVHFFQARIKGNNYDASICKFSIKWNTLYTFP